MCLGVPRTLKFSMKAWTVTYENLTRLQSFNYAGFCTDVFHWLGILSYRMRSWRCSMIMKLMTRSASSFFSSHSAMVFSIFSYTSCSLRLVPSPYILLQTLGKELYFRQSSFQKVVFSIGMITCDNYNIMTFRCYSGFDSFQLKMCQSFEHIKQQE